MLTLDAALYDLLMEVSGALGGAIGATRARLEGAPPLPPPLLQLRGGYAESPGWFLVQAAEFAPAPLTVATLRERDVYGSEAIVAALLALLAGDGWLERRGAEAYYLTEAGQTFLTTRLTERPRRFLAALDPAPPAALQQAVTDRLARLITASLAAPTPPGTWCLAHSRCRAPAPDDLPLLLIRQYLDDFNAFRDDAHMAAWQPLGVAGYAWEAFGFLCRGEAAGAGEVFARLMHRGYSAEDYAAALAGLAGRGWLAPGGADSYTVTPAGRAVRAAAEQATDAYFYAPWAILSEAEQAALQADLLALRDALAAVG